VRSLVAYVASEAKCLRADVIDEDGDVIGYVSAKNLRELRSQHANEELEEQIALTMRETPGMTCGKALSEVVRRNPKLWTNHRLLGGERIN
jgi:hypothetical protein